MNEASNQPTIKLILEDSHQSMFPSFSDSIERANFQDIKMDRSTSSSSISQSNRSIEQSMKDASMQASLYESQFVPAQFAQLFS